MIIIFTMVAFLIMIFGGVAVGMAVGYGQGYEDGMLEKMTEEEKDDYFKTKALYEKKY